MTLYLNQPAKDVDFAKLTVYPFGEPSKNHIFFKEAKCLPLADGTGYLVAGFATQITADYRGKDDLTIEKQPWIYFEVHSKTWSRWDYTNKKTVDVEPTLYEQWLCSQFDSVDIFQTGFSGFISTGEHSTLFEMLDMIPEDKLKAKLSELVEVVPVDLSDEFNKKRLPPTDATKRASYGGTKAQTEIEKLTERAKWLASFVDDNNAAGIHSSGHKTAMALFYPLDKDGNFAPQHYRNYVALILGATSVV
jgi:hypothetical protein